MKNTAKRKLPEYCSGQKHRDLKRLEIDETGLRKRTIMKLKITVTAILLSIAILILCINVSLQKENPLHENKHIAKIFDINNITGTFVIYNSKTKILREYNPYRAKQQFVPGSIFKIANAYIALSERIISNVDDIFYKHDGSSQFLATWEQDSSLRVAMKHSNVPAFQQLARGIGFEKYQSYLTNYGNSKTGSVIDKFWLDGPLSISAIEQALYLSAVLEEDSPILPLLKDILFQEEINGWKLYAKTGWAKEIGWFVGFIGKGDTCYSFAFNMDLSDSKLLPMRQEITKQILLELDLG